ncbi:hypothetical protein J6590_060727 [Homalodisca vitripennis]|nr:hypothetical protein J6590_060727 [Homalodisca vitripennis]
MSRQDATELLMGEKEGGVFLVRDSNSIHGDYVLCVREDSKVSHYIINKIQQSDHTKYRIGDQMFPDLPNLLAFYKLHYLDTTPLIRPAPRKIEKVIAKYDFDGSAETHQPYSSLLEFYMMTKVVLSSFLSQVEEWWLQSKMICSAVSVSKLRRGHKGSLSNDSEVVMSSKESYYPPQYWDYREVSCIVYGQIDNTTFYCIYHKPIFYCAHSLGMANHADRLRTYKRGLSSGWPPDRENLETNAAYVVASLQTTDGQPTESNTHISFIVRAGLVGRRLETP